MEPRLAGASSYHSRNRWRIVASCRFQTAATMALTAVREHERASTMPRLHRANTVAWGLLNWGKCCMIVVCPWSTLAWQCMAFLLGTVGSRTPHNMPQGGKPCHISTKAYPSEGIQVQYA